MRKNLLAGAALIALIWQTSVAAQEPSQPAATPATIDTMRLLSDKPVKSPWGAVLRSAVLPGWGQMYNHKPIKAGLALTLNGFLLSRIIHFDNRWQETRNQDFRDSRNLFTWYLGLTYLLTLVDAYVDAQLFGFDQAVALQILPAPAEGPPALIALRLQF